MQREQKIRIGILSVVFVLAIIIFSIITNHGSTDMTADMGAPTLPTLSFQSAGKEINLLVGHRKEMDMVAMRDTIVVYEKGKNIKVNVHAYGEDIKSLTYEVYSLDGSKKLQDETIKKVGESVELKMDAGLKKNQEGILRISLKLDRGTVYYYTRVIQNQEYRVKECLEYAEKMHENLIKKENEDSVKKVMESNSQGDNTTLNHVTIHSDLRHVMWGDLKPKVVGKPCIEMKEAKKAYTSVQLSYQVECAGDNNKKETYNVKEFFKVAYGTSQVYLLEYDRTMEEVFDTANVVLSSKGIVLGIVDGSLPCKVNKEGNIAAFIQADELWSYSKEEAFSLVFSFADSEKDDIRNLTDRHSIQMLSMEDNGDMTFSVCGYMNRGVHEGESGVAVYFYSMEHNSVEEVAFIPSKLSPLMIEKELNELAYYNKKQEVLYVMVDGTLLKVKDRKQTVVMEGLQPGRYVASDDGHLLAYQTEKDGTSVTQIWDFAKERKWEVKTEDGGLIVPLGFVGDDFVYGITKAEYSGVDVVGAAVQAMERLEIRNTDNEVVKTYQKKDVFILDAMIENNMITLQQATKSGNVYTEIAEDYITDNTASGNEYVSLQSYWTDLKETQYRIVFSEGIKDKHAKVMKPKQVIMETPTMLDVQNEIASCYYVYGHGEQMGIFADAGNAVSLADSLAGVVISPKQNYVWEADNRVSWYRNFEVDRYIQSKGNSGVENGVRTILAYEGKKTDAAAELGSKTVLEILREQLKTEAVQFRATSVQDMRYLIDKGVPVLALKDASNAILLIGYDARTITYVDLATGTVLTGSFDRVNELLAGSGRTFIGYVK